MNSNYQYYANRNLQENSNRGQRIHVCVEPVINDRNFNYLLRRNFLSEYSTEEDKMEVLYNLGVPDLIKKIIQEYIVQYFGDSKKLAISQKTLTDAINSINNRIDEILENNIKANLTINPNYAYIGIENSVTIKLNLVDPVDSVIIYRIIEGENPTQIFESEEHKTSYQINDTVTGHKDKNITYEAEITAGETVRRISNSITSRQQNILDFIRWESDKEWIIEEDKQVYSTIFNPGNTYPILIAPEDVASITYTSSNHNVATIDEITGTISISGFGDSIITAFVNGGDKYTTNSISYVLRIRKELVTILWNPISITTDMINKVVPIFSKPLGVIILHTINPDDETITINDNNIVQINKPGSVHVETTINDPIYEGDSASFDIIITKAVPQYNWDLNTIDIVLGETSYNSPVLQNVPSGLNVTYELISGNNVININSTTGEITEILGLGTAVIRATTQETNIYALYHADCTVNVVVPPIPDYYIGWATGDNASFDGFAALSDNPLAENYIASLATSYSKISTPSITKTITAAESTGTRQIFFLMWKQGSAPVNGSVTSGGITDNFSATDFVNTNVFRAIHNDVTIDGTSYHVAGLRGAFDENDVFVVNF